MIYLDNKGDIMRKLLKVLSLLAFAGGIVVIILSILITGGFDLIYIGIIIASIGLIGCLLTYNKPSAFIWDLIELVLDIVS